MAPPQNPKSTSAVPPAASALARSPLAVVVTGTLFRGMSTIVVTPPAAAARVAVWNPSHSVRPGSFTWTWVSTTPAITTEFPTSSRWRASGARPGASRAVIVPSVIASAAGATPSSVTTRELVITRSAVGMAGDDT